MAKDNIADELNQLLSKPPKYYSQLIIKNNEEFDFEKSVILFGAAKLCSVFIRYFRKRKMSIIALSDNNKKLFGKKIEGIKIISKKDIKKIYGSEVQIIATSLYYPEITKDLNRQGFRKVFSPLYFSTLFAREFDVLVWKNDIDLIIKNKKYIKQAYKYLADTRSRKIFLKIIKFRLLLHENLQDVRDYRGEYFDKEIIHLSNEEVFLDGGAYDGDTVKMMIKESKNRFSALYAFEPDTVNYKKLSDLTKQLKDTRIKIFKEGVGDKKSTLHFTNEGNLQSKVIKNGETLVKIISIDSHINARFSYIKLDIEGFEKKALLGAKKTIKIHKPKLAICAYHNANDLWELPIVIKSLRTDYRLFLRQYSDFILDTICYAV